MLTVAHMTGNTPVSTPVRGEPAPEPMLTGTELCRRLRIHATTLWRWQNPDLESCPLTPDVRHGRTIRFRLSTVEAWLKSAPPRGKGGPGHPRPGRRGGRPRNIDRGGNVRGGDA